MYTHAHVMYYKRRTLTPACTLQRHRAAFSLSQLKLVLVHSAVVALAVVVCVAGDQAADGLEHGLGQAPRLHVPASSRPARRRAARPRQRQALQPAAAPGPLGGLHSQGTLLKLGKFPRVQRR